MAVTKLWERSDDLRNALDYVTNKKKTSKANSEYSQTDYQALRDIIAYAVNEEKTEQEFFCDGINCSVPTAREQMIATKEQYGETDGIQVYHGYLSFAEQDITPETAQRVGMEFARRMWGERFQAVVTTHLNTQHLHCHFVINSVSFVDGKRLAGKEKYWYYFRHVADDVCRDFGLYFDPDAKPSKKAAAKNAAARSGTMPHIKEARWAIDKALKYSYTLQDFKARLGDMGYTLAISPNRKHWTIMRDTWERPRRLYKLGEGYTEEDIVKRIQLNGIEVRHMPSPIPRRTVKRQFKGSSVKGVRRIGGFRGLYLHYCYRLGIIPARRQASVKQLYYTMGSEIKQADRLSAQTRLLCRERIDTMEQLKAYKTGLEKKADGLLARRKKLYAQARKLTGSGEPEAAVKAEISAITAEIKTLRNDIRLCEGIEERSAAYAEQQRKLREKEEIKKEEKRYGKW